MTVTIATVDDDNPKLLSTAMRNCVQNLKLDLALVQLKPNKFSGFRKKEVPVYNNVITKVFAKFEKFKVELLVCRISAS